MRQLTLRPPPRVPERCAWHGHARVRRYVAPPLALWLFVAAVLVGCAGTENAAQPAQPDALYERWNATVHAALEDGGVLRREPDAPGGPIDPEAQAQVESLQALGLRKLAARELDAADAAFGRVLALAPGHAGALYNRACVASLRGDLDESLDQLDQAALAGFLDFEHADADADLAAVRADPAYATWRANRPTYAARLARQRMLSLRWRLGPDYVGVVDATRRIILVTQADTPNREAMLGALGMLADGLTQSAPGLVTPAGARATPAATAPRRLFQHRPDRYLAVVIPSPEDFARLIPDSALGGLYIPRQDLLLARALDYTLRHEFVHVLHIADLSARGARARIWLLEGIATLFENAVYAADGSLMPVASSRVDVLRELHADNDLPAWRDLFNMTQPTFMDRGPEHYAVVRSIAWFFWERGKLRAVYDEAIATWQVDGSGALAISRAFGTSLEEVEAAWRRWVGTQPSFVRQVRAAVATVGLGLAATSGVLRVGEVRPDSPASRAGLAVGDQLESVGARPLLSQDDWVDEVLGFATRRAGGAIVVATRTLRSATTTTAATRTAGRPGERQVQVSSTTVRVRAQVQVTPADRRVGSRLGRQLAARQASTAGNYLPPAYRWAPKPAGTPTGQGHTNG